MEKIKINYNGKVFLRETESITEDTIRVYWWEKTEYGNKEILDQDQLDTLERYFVSNFNDIIPELPII
jgi:hypothetical protein